MPHERDHLQHGHWLHDRADWSAVAKLVPNFEVRYFIKRQA